MRIIRSLAGAATLLACSYSTNAHHSYAMFDTSQALTVRGTLKILEWTNPHVWLWVDVNDEKEKRAFTYGFETLSPAQLMRDYGWEKKRFRAGEEVVVVYAPLKSGNRGGALIKLTLSDGQTLETRFSAPREAAPTAVTGK
jgi:hypothetical protein